MRSEHLAIDGAVVSFEGGANLSSRATAAGWVIVPSLMRAYPFVAYPAGHTHSVERAVASEVDKERVRVLRREDFNLKKGVLRTAVVERPIATGGTRQITAGGWEGRNGCLTTSLVGDATKELVEMFDTLRFVDSTRGVYVESPVVSKPRSPEVIKEVPDLGIIAVRPATSLELERVPRDRGHQIANGELFRISERSSALLFVSRTAIASITPVIRRGTTAVGGDLLSSVRDLRIEWKPQAVAAR